MKDEMTQTGSTLLYTLWFGQLMTKCTLMCLKTQDTMSVVWVCIPDLAAPFMCYMTYGQVTFFFLRVYYLFI